MKKIVYVLGAIIVLVVAVAIYVFVFAGDLIKTAVERVGSDATQAEVTLSKVDLDMFQGTGGMQGLIVGNPKGFKSPSAFELGSISMQIDTDTVGKNPVVIKSIAITGPIVTYEKSGGTSNIDAIKANVDAYAKQFAGSGGEAKTEEKSSGDDQKLVIEKLTITGGQVKLNAGMLGDKSLDASLPDLTLTDPSTWLDIVNGRSSILFALLAGVSLALMKTAISSMPAAWARSSPRAFGQSPLKVTPSVRGAMRATSSPSASCGTQLGETNEVISIRLSPDATSASMRRTFRVVGTVTASGWRPSRGETS